MPARPTGWKACATLLQLRPPYIGLDSNRARRDPTPDFRLDLALCVKGRSGMIGEGADFLNHCDGGVAATGCSDA